jgi:hypothetical protein
VAVTAADKIAISNKLNLSQKQIESIGRAMGLSPGQVWEWLKKKLKDPGKKIPRPGHGLPSFDVPQWVILLLVGYLMFESE